MRPGTAVARKRLYEQARAIVARDYRRPLTLGALASELAASPRQLQRAYAQEGTTSFAEDLRACRLAVAAELLRTQPGLSVAQVGALSGYPAASHFARVFRAAHDLTPTEYRARRASAQLSGGEAARRRPP